MDDLFVHTLRDIYYAEKQIVKALPEMIEKANDPQLKQGFQTHLQRNREPRQTAGTGVPVGRRESPRRRLPGDRWHHRGSQRRRRRSGEKAVLDAALIAAAQAVEHYEMTRYGTLIAWAKQLGRNDCTTLLQQTLDEEKATDKKLTQMAESQVNRKAA